MIEEHWDPPARVAAAPRWLPAMLGLFVGSGCAALIYEIVWLQMLQLVIGLTAVSLGVLLGTFMGGMCLGSLLLARLVPPHRHPLRVYALIEVGIGGIGIALLFAMPLVDRLYSAWGGQGLPGVLLRGAVAAACLLPPTMLMGATLPAMARWIEATPKGVSWLGFFYGGNIAGAVGGCLLTGFYLLRVHDAATATYVAAGINLAVALAALGLAAKAPHTAPAADEPRKTGVELARGAGAVYVTIALSGLSALGAEVVWTRVMSLLLGATVYTFSIILAVFLLGLGLGSSVGSLLARSVAQPRRALGVCQLLLTVAMAWTAYMTAGSLPYWPINPSLSVSPWYNFQLDLARCLWAILPAACLWGASFPLALAAVASPGKDPGRLVGGVYAANTLGAIVGALGFSLLVIPWLGTQWAQRLLIGLGGLGALVALVPLRSGGRTGDAAPGEPRPPVLWRMAGVAGTLGLVLWLAAGVSPIPWGLIAYGRFMATYGDRLIPGILEEKDVPWVTGGQDIYCTYAGEGLNGAVAVTVSAEGVRSFHSAGKIQASNLAQDMRLQRMLGHLSALAHPEPKSVLVVACGAGVTAGSFVPHPSIERIVICDIEPLVPQHVTPRFKVENYDVLHDPRVRVVCDDGRHFLRTTTEKFDIITSDPIDPWVKGCAALNTTDYYRMCLNHLNPGGVMSLWMPLYESNAQASKSVIATFFHVFTNGVFWSNDQNGSGYDAVLFGQAGPTRIDLDQWESRLARADHARVKQSLKDAGFESVVALLATYAGQAPDLGEWMRDAQINTDRNLRLQYLAGMWLNSFEGAKILGEITRHYRFPTNLFIGPEAGLQPLREAIEKPRQLDRAGKTP